MALFSYLPLRAPSQSRLRRASSPIGRAKGRLRRRTCADLPSAPPGASKFPLGNSVVLSVAPKKRKRRIFMRRFLNNMGWMMGLEPTIFRATI